MTDLRKAAQQALEAWQTATYGHPSHHKATLLAMTALSTAVAQQAEPVQKPVAYTTGHCGNHKQKGGCQLHNLQCGWPDCDRKPTTAPPQQAEPAQEPVATLIAQRDALRAELKEATEAINDPAVNNLRTLPESIRVLCVQRDALLEALKEAATSLETVGRLAGKSDYLGDAGERIPTYMGRHDEVREYATSRAGVARAAIKAVEGEKT